MSTVKSKEDAAYVVQTDDLIPTVDNAGTVGKSVTPLQIVASAFGPNTVMVLPTDNLNDLVQTVGDRKVKRDELATTLTVFNGGQTVTFAGGGLIPPALTEAKIRVNDLILMPDARYYKVKSIPVDGALEIHEPYVGGTVLSTVFTVESFYYDWINFLLLAGHHTAPDGGISVFPGMSFTGIDKYATSISEFDSAPVAPFIDWSENSVSNLTFKPSTTFSDCDAIILVDADAIGGSKSVVSNCVINDANLGGIHTTGLTNFPGIAYGYSVIENCDLMMDGGGFIQMQGRGIATISPTNTKVLFKNNHHRYISSFDTAPGGNAFFYNAIVVSHAITVDAQDCTMDIEDFNELEGDTTFGTATAFLLVRSEASVVNLNNVVAKLKHKHGANPCAGVEILADAGAAIVNITHCDFEADNTGAGGSSAIYNRSLTATVNIRLSRLKGGTSAVDNAGIMNIDTPSIHLGGDVNTGTLNLNTAT